MTIRWISPKLGTAPAMSISQSDDISILDVRDLVDKGGNNGAAVMAKIRSGAAELQAGKRLVVACDYGISRSNAIAAGVIALSENIPVDQAIRRVIAATGEQEIKLELLAAVRGALEPGPGARASNGDGTVLITGGSGFLGAALADRMRKGGRTVVTPRHDEIDLEKSRAELDMLVRQQDVGCIVHLANPRVYTSNQALGSTLTILRNVLEICSLNGIALVFPSGWEIYSGYTDAEILADEKLPPLPHGPYGETKWLAECLVNHFRQHAGLECSLLRMSPVYGPDGTRPKFIYNFLHKALRGEKIDTHLYRNAPAGLDLMHRDDAVNALMLAVSSKFRGDLNIGTGRITPTAQVAEWIAAWTGSRSEIGLQTIDADTARVAMDARLAGEKLGWHPTIDAEAGLQAAIGSYLKSNSEKSA